MCKPQIRSRQRCEEKCRQAKSGGVEPLKNLWSAKEFREIHINSDYMALISQSQTNSYTPSQERTSIQKNVLEMPPMPNENLAQKLMFYPFAKYSDGGN